MNTPRHHRPYGPGDDDYGRETPAKGIGDGIAERYDKAMKARQWPPEVKRLVEAARLLEVANAQTLHRLPEPIREGISRLRFARTAVEASREDIPIKDAAIHEYTKHLDGVASMWKQRAESAERERDAVGLELDGWKRSWAQAKDELTRVERERDELRERVKERTKRPEGEFRVNCPPLCSRCNKFHWPLDPCEEGPSDPA